MFEHTNREKCNTSKLKLKTEQNESIQIATQVVPDMLRMLLNNR